MSVLSTLYSSHIQQTSVNLSTHLGGKKKSVSESLRWRNALFNTLGCLEPTVHIGREEGEGAEHKALFSPS